MRLKGWNEIPSDFDLEIAFDKGPRWLEMLALTPLVERWAYPIGVSKGVVYLRAPDNFSRNTPNSIIGWEIKANPKSVQEKFLEGSLADFSLSIAQSKGSNKGSRKFTLTRWGRIKVTRKWVHKRNGTYSYYKSGTFPPNMV